jgi:hypothetical protein
MGAYGVVGTTGIAIGLLFALMMVGHRGSNFLASFIIMTGFVWGVGGVVILISRKILGRFKRLS